MALVKSFWGGGYLRPIAAPSWGPAARCIQSVLCARESADARANKKPGKTGALPGQGAAAPDARPFKTHVPEGTKKGTQALAGYPRI